MQHYHRIKQSIPRIRIQSFHVVSELVVGRWIPMKKIMHFWISKWTWFSEELILHRHERQTNKTKLTGNKNSNRLAPVIICHSYFLHWNKKLQNLTLMQSTLTWPRLMSNWLKETFWDETFSRLFFFWFWWKIPWLVWAIFFSLCFHEFFISFVFKVL